MEKVRVKIKKLFSDAVVPTYGTNNSAGADLYAYLDKSEEIKPGESKFISTGVCMEIPEGLVGLVYARSGLACKQGLAPANKVGVIDSDYRGEVKVVLHNHSSETRVVENGQRIAQIVFAPYVFGDFEVVDQLQDTARGEGSFGSTGKK
ncbi:MAG: dUTP diphosphatase [Christensenellales bacterium]